jgi:hypothetical protein
VNGKTIGVGPVEIPSYLDRPQIVTLKGPHQIPHGGIRQMGRDPKRKHQFGDCRKPVCNASGRPGVCFSLEKCQTRSIPDHGPDHAL